ncbi:hypothetical protein E3E38_06055 [Thermococcus sp. 18S1]|uniref:hypothetical protein n=1 Tax=Thermococcus sp. 18S1 TaxID=1638210 RepID=UPI00143C5BE8|nr:hypothetical protein [Thermococcus sp. 18S1]NJE30610.1 hypothetical protein [Thermococcus sp. 18S1]
MRDDTFSVLQEFISPREAFEQLDLLAPHFIGRDATAETVILSVKYEELMLQLEGLLEDADRIKAALEAGNIDPEEAKIELLDVLYGVRNIIGELEVVEALRARFGVGYVEVLSEYLRALGAIAFAELVQKNGDVVSRVKQEVAQRWGIYLPSLEGHHDVRGDDS